MKVAIYARVSTTKQDNGNSSITTSTRNPGRLPTGLSSSGCLPTLPNGSSTFSCFWALDRLSREGVLETPQHLRRLESYGVCYRSYTEPYFDSCGAFKDVILTVMATLAKQERVKRSERTKAGLARVKASGKRLGRPVAIDGQRAAEIARMRSAGLSLRAIGRELGISDRSVRRATAA